VAALDAGADDYVTKPFGWTSCSHACEPRCAVGRQVSPARPSCASRISRWTSRSASFDPRRAGASHPHGVRAARGVRHQPGKLLTHQWLLRKVWGQGYGQESHYLRVYVRALRKKLGDDAGAPKLILTEPGVGYRWIAEPRRDDTRIARDGHAETRPKGTSGGVFKRFLVGRAMSSQRSSTAAAEDPRAARLRIGRAVSVAYATGEIFIQLTLVSLAFKHLVMPISIAMRS